MFADEHLKYSGDGRSVVIPHCEFDGLVLESCHQQLIPHNVIATLNPRNVPSCHDAHSIQKQLNTISERNNSHVNFSAFSKSPDVSDSIAFINDFPYC